VRRLPRFGFTLITPATIAIVLLVPSVTRSQDVTEPALKAAYIYNFVKFTEWPGNAPASDALVLCVLGDSDVGDALVRVVKGREVGGHPLTVSNLATSGPIRGCHVLYISGMKSNQAALVIADLHGAPVLTLSDIVGFTEGGGIAQFFFDRGQLRFSISHEAAKRVGLQLSSKLLDLGKRMGSNDLD
jgi:hypothetical protein